MWGWLRLFHGWHWCGRFGRRRWCGWRSGQIRQVSLLFGRLGLGAQKVIQIDFFVEIRFPLRQALYVHSDGGFGHAWDSRLPFRSLSFGTQQSVQVSFPFRYALFSTRSTLSFGLGRWFGLGAPAKQNIGSLSTLFNA
jgi:hypothetical protein